MNKFMENCYKKVEGFLDACGKFFATEEDAWVSDAARELMQDYNAYIRNCSLGKYDPYKPMTLEQAERTVRKALEFTQSKGCK